MSVNLKGRHFISVKDFDREELWQVLRTAEQLKLAYLRGDRPAPMAGKTLAMIFQKPSLRTRVSFEAGMTRLGGHAIYLAPQDIKLGQREITEDIALVLSRMADVIMARVFGHYVVEDLAKYATVPVINGLSDREHPCQILADLLTIHEKHGRLEGLKAAFVGDGNNVAHSLLYGAALTGMHLTVVTPSGFEPKDDIVQDARRLATNSGAQLQVTNDLPSAARGADVIYTDVWASMGQEAEAEERKNRFAPYQVNAKVLAAAHPQAILLHCQPAHYGEEIDYQASRTPNCVMFDQAENRLHAQNALLVLVAGA